MWKKRTVLLISIIVFLVIAGAHVLFQVGHWVQITQTDLKQQESNKAGNKANKRTEKETTKKTEQVKKLTLSNIDVDVPGVYFYDTGWITNYSQVADGHYYWLRHDGDTGKYIIYRDNKKRVGMFETPYLPDSDVDYNLNGFVKYGSNFYALISHYDIRREENERDVQELARVNLETGKLEVLYDVSEAHIPGDGKFLFCCIYQDDFYFDKRTIWQSSYMRSGISVRLPLEGGTAEEISELPSTTNLKKAKPYLLYMDNKIFYAVKEDSKVKLFCYDMQSDSEQQFFQFKEKQNSNEESSFLEIDKDYIYYGNDMISRKTGKVFSPFQNMKKSKGSRKNYTANDKYVFYLDKQNRVHRLDKKTKRDIIIRKEKTLAVSCVGNRLYIRVRDEKGYNKCNKVDYDIEEVITTEYYADNLYCMDVDGKREKKLWNGGYDYR